MKCPHCGQEMPDGHLLCGHCGEEIRIVPDFEPEIETEIENSITKTLAAMADMQEEGAAGKEARTDDDTAEAVPAEAAVLMAAKSWRPQIIMGLVILFVAALISYALYAYHIHTVDYQIDRAHSFAERGAYDQAIACLEAAYQEHPEVAEFLFLEADYYYLQQMDAYALSALMRIIDNERTAPFSEEDVEEAYGKIVVIYANQEAYTQINELLQGCDKERVVSRFQSYLAMEPEFSYVEGSYEEVIPLKLSSNTAGTIYYTMDGTKPDRNSQIYTAPLFLEMGEYTISAFFVNDFGIESGVVTKTYVIDLTVPNAPEVELYSGEYTEATMISVEQAPNCKTYYTTDESEPTADSVPYTGPIPMPLGKTLFKFVNISEEGIASEVTTRTFTLRLRGAILPTDAVTNLVNRLVETGYLEDASGKNPRQSGNLSYRFSSVVKIGEDQDYYTINEYYDDGSGTPSRTDKVFLVQAYTGETAQLGYDEAGAFVANPV
ncbi:MAG: chitobiase/beta-hexosaminidase C-terminal domain-containing protein [Bacteroidales bacterium]|nr:chitobiase/beta-hexosaminidase C-terminal domain-containing protein [Bacteroidales bacterium]MCM1416876.1 chitobiase/beta-hexosaminidase C-terminal domain-containing protein [bacterium]MCM1424900.1 chitobiase/beta-hexosaminidase C-terminal domain-containing protein [bacterium]